MDLKRIDQMMEKVMLFVLACLPLCISGFAITVILLSEGSIIEERWMNQRWAAFVLVLVAVASSLIAGFLIHSLVKSIVPEKTEVKEQNGEEEIRRIKHIHRMRTGEIVIISRK